LDVLDRCPQWRHVVGALLLGILRNQRIIIVRIRLHSLDFDQIAADCLMNLPRQSTGIPGPGVVENESFSSRLSLRRYYPSRRQSAPAFAVLADAPRYRG
jgi:hypothetical protein